MFEISVDANAVAATDELIARLRDLSPALAEIGAYLEGRTKQRFLKQVDPQGNPWAPLADSTIAAKKQRKAPLDILRDRGFLVSSIAFTVGSDEVRIGTAQEYAKWLQDGVEPYTRARTGFFKGSYTYEHPGMPARPFLGFEDGDPDAISGILRRHINGQL